MDSPVTIYVKLKTDEKSDIISISRDQGEIRIQDSKSHTYTFPRIFPGNITMQELFDNTTKPLTTLLKSGQSSVLLAYGPRYTGKKTTLFFHPEKGLFSSIIETLLDFANESEKLKETIISLSIIEVFDESIHDLAYGVKNDQSFEVFERSLEIKEQSGKAFLPSATSIDVFSVPEAEDVLKDAFAFRTKFESKTREYSDKASTFVIIYLKQRTKGSTWNQIATSALVLGCLASAERPKVRNGKEVYEYPAVHKAFNALTKVLGNVKSPKVPWRDHVLTKVLKVGMPDVPKVVILAHVNPGKSCTQDSIYSLKFMEKCRPGKSDGVAEKMTEEEMDLQILRLQEEKVELKGRFKKIEASQENQMKKLCELMGITDDLDGIINETNEKELDLIQTRKESFLQIEKTVKKNLDLEKKLEESQTLLQRVKKAEYLIQDSHLKKIIDLKDHLQRLKDELVTIKFNSKYYENEKVDSKSQELQQMVQNSKNLIMEKKNILQNLPVTLNPAIKPLNPEELKGQGKKEVNVVYRRRFDEQIRRQKEEIREAEDRKKQSVVEKQKVLENMVSNFKKTRSEKKSKVKELLKELAGLYECLKGAKRTLTSIQNGKFNQSLREVNIPQERLPSMPTPETFPEVFKYLKVEEKSSIHPIMQLKSKSMRDSLTIEDHLIEVKNCEGVELIDLIQRLTKSSEKVQSDISEFESKEKTLKINHKEIQDSLANLKHERELYRELLSKEQKSITESKFVIENQRKIIENIGAIPVKSPQRPFSQGIQRTKK